MSDIFIKIQFGIFVRNSKIEAKADLIPIRLLCLLSQIETFSRASKESEISDFKGKSNQKGVGS